MNTNEKIDKYISDIADWRREILARLRELIHEVDPEIVEEWKWDVPVFVHKTMVCAISSFSDHAKINFFKGAKLNDTYKVFNNGLESKQHRSIDFFEGDKINEKAIKELLASAVELS